ncbi:MAG: Kdo hydroxylase family protein [Verrucomicrobia bacterium]|nr:Kdo hydroxylase family protein [Verrucomicrobiota bacterium]
MMALYEIPDFKYPQGWTSPDSRVKRSTECCRKLEEGEILFFPETPFEIPEADREFLVETKQSGLAFHKNISYRPKQDVLRGTADGNSVQQMHRIMKYYSETVTSFLSKLLEPYAKTWRHDYASFRSIEEEGRDLPVNRRNDLLHLDAFPTRPTGGDRILRCFTNVNPNQSRVWVTGDPIETIASRFANDAGLSALVSRRFSPLGRIQHSMEKSLASLTGKVSRTAYDEFMLKFHDYLKQRRDYQEEQDGKLRSEFPPFSTWITFTDAVPHSVVSGQFALEQTFIVPISAMVSPEKSPLRVLEKIAGQRLSA